MQPWLKHQRLKHTADLVPVRRQGRRAARRLEVTMAASKDDHKAGAVRKHRASRPTPPSWTGCSAGGVADVLVTDLRTGIAHGSHDDRGGLSRSPLDLLERAVPHWLPLVRPGGAFGLSWNVKVARRELAEDILLAERAGNGAAAGARAPGRPGHRAGRADRPETRLIRRAAAVTCSPMFTETAVFDLLLPGDSQSLKQKRSYVRPIIAMLRKFE